jgi:hypothetical protein
MLDNDYDYDNDNEPPRDFCTDPLGSTPPPPDSPALGSSDEGFRSRLAWPAQSNLVRSPIRLSHTDPESVLGSET